MSYSQLIQFKRLEERGFIIFNGKQVMFAVFGIFIGMALVNKLGAGGWLPWLLVALSVLTGLIMGARFRGLYLYQYLYFLSRSLVLSKSISPGELYDRPPDEDLSYVIGTPDGSALLMRQAPTARYRSARQTGGAATYRLKPVDLAQHNPRAVRGLMQRWAGFWAGARAPLRLVVHSTPFFAGEVVERVRDAGQAAEEDWRSLALLSYGRFLERLTREAVMYQAEHELMVWAGSDSEAHAAVSSMAGWLGVSATPAELSSALPGDYEILRDYLRPLDPRHPYIILLVSHEFSGEWNWADPLVTILRQSFPVSLVIDVERNLASNEALKELVKYENVLLDVLANARGRDPKAEGALGDVKLAMGRANAGNSLHFSTVVAAVKGATLAEVRKNVETVRALTAARLALVSLPGGQGELLKFFTTTRRREINLPEVSHNVTSDGMAVVCGALGFRRRSETGGIFWGIGSSGGQDTYPIFWNGYGADPDKPAAYHGIFLGKSGYGKTVAMNALLYREALRDTQVILMEPQGHSRRLYDLVGAEGASYNPLSLAEMRINPLDPVFDNLSDQKAYQIDLYRLMLKQVDPGRRLTGEEAGVLDGALSVLYSGLRDPFRTPARHIPRLEQLCHELQRQGAGRLARELELNYVGGSLGTVFNQPTTTDVGLEAAVVAYDFKDIPTSIRTLIYTLVLGRIQRVVRATGRVRRRVVAIDEYGWLAQEPLLSQSVAMWIKTFRTFGCGVWVAEQDLIRLTGGAGGGDLSGHSIIGNSVFQLFFHHEAAAAEVVARTFPNVAPYREMIESFPRPQDTGLAEAALRLPDGAYHTYMLLSDVERNYLIGS
jgi:hypothetical protein